MNPLRKLFGLVLGRRTVEARTLSRDEARKLRDSQRETLRVLQQMGEAARNREALEYARRRTQEIKRLEQEYDLYNLDRGD
jgi:hypothetical protein